MASKSFFSVVLSLMSAKHRTSSANDWILVNGALAGNVN
jgi:hypothetical protein